MLKCLVRCFGLFALLATASVAQESAATQANAPGSSKPTEHLIGTVTAVDPASHTITVKEDKTGSVQKVLVGNTRTLLKVEPGAKDLKNATRITPDDLQVGDRVDVRGSKPEDDPNAIAARSVVLMSARDLQKAHQAEAAAWQHSTAGVVNSVDPAAGKLAITVRTPAGAQPVTVDTAKTTQFTRYSPENPKVPAPSELAQIQPGDHVRIIGNRSDDGSTITAEKVYSGAFRTVNGTIVSISPDGKSITVKDLATKKPVEISLNNDSEIRKLPPTVAMMLARRLNPNFHPAQGGQRPSGEQHEANTGSRPAAPAYGANEQGNSAQASGARRGPSGGSDIGQMIERLPPISVSDLKPGDAVVVSGVETGAGSSRLLATNIIAGVEPILQSAPARSGGESTGGDWGLGEMTIPQ